LNDIYDEGLIQSAFVDVQSEVDKDKERLALRSSKPERKALKHERKEIRKRREKR